MTQTLLGWVTLGVPLLLLGLYFLWRRYRPVLWMYLGALLIGFGYLTATGAMREIGGPLNKLVSGERAPLSAPTTPAPAR